MRVLLLAPVLAAIQLAGCAQDSSCPGNTGDFRGDRGVAQSVVVERSIFYVPVTAAGAQNAEPVYAALDSGAPVTVLDPTKLGLEGIPAPAFWEPESLSFLGLRFERPRIIAANVLSSGLLAGVIGADVLCHFVVGLDYRHQEVTLDPDEQQLRGPLGPVATQGFVFEGGGSTGEQVLPPTRIPIQVDIEGRAGSFVVDTGASVTTVSDALFRDLSSDGRATLEGLDALTAVGSAMLALSRAREVRTPNTSAGSVVFGKLSVGLLASLTAELGHPVDGLLGGTYLRNFYTLIDYPGSQLRLRPYLEGTTQDEFHRVGILVQQMRDRAFVTEIFPRTDASTKALRRGTRIVSIDGTPLDGSAEQDPDTLLEGEVGALRVLTTTTGTVTVRVDDLLPLP